VPLDEGHSHRGAGRVDRNRILLDQEFWRLGAAGKRLLGDNRSELMATFKFRLRGERIQVALHFFVFLALAFLIFRNNPSCLFFSLDGTYSVIMRDIQAIAREPFSQLGADPLQGNFDAYLPPFHEYLLPNLLAMLLGDGPPTKTTTFTIYAGLMILSVYLLGRAVRIDRAPVLFAGLLYPVPALPMFIGSLPLFYHTYTYAPHFTQVTSLTLLTLACIWALEEQTILRSILLALAALFCVVWMMLSSSLIVLSIPTLLFFGVASLFSAKRWQLDIPRVITGIVIIVTLAMLGIFSYLYVLYKYNTTSFFYDELFNPRAGGYFFASVVYYDNSVGRIIAAGAVAGAVYSAIVGQRRLRAFALAYLAYTAIFHVLAFAVTNWLHAYAGPSPVYFEFMLWPLNMLFAAIAFFAVVDAIAFFAVLVVDRGHAVPRFSTWHRSVLRYSLLGTIGLGLLAGNASAAATDRCGGLRQFSRLLPTPLTERLRETIAFHPGSFFRGLVATFTGYQEKSGVSLNDIIPHDIVLWDKTGNDHRTVGLWRYNIPTLYQFNQFMTPAYYLMLSRFLSRPEDRQMRAT
jgi:hypothetical protein